MVRTPPLPVEVTMGARTVKETLVPAGAVAVAVADTAGTDGAGMVAAYALSGAMAVAAAIIRAETVSSMLACILFPFLCFVIT
jgi:hypothetical protein